MSVERVTADVVVKEMALVQHRIPLLARACRGDLLKLFTQRGQANIYGGVLAQNGPNAALARYFGAAIRDTKEDDGTVLTAGLPVADEQARILGHRETGGTIRPKNVRYLRVPLDAAKTEAGFDRYAGIRLRELRGTDKDVFKFIPTPRAPRAVGILVKRAEWERVNKRNPSKTRTHRYGKGVNERSRTIAGNQARAWYALVASVTNRPFPWAQRSAVETEALGQKIVEARLDAWSKGRAGTLAGIMNEGGA